MATFTSGPHQSPQSQLPPLAYKTVNTLTWGAGGNSSTIVDPYIHPQSVLHIWTVGTTARAGVDWAQNITQGQCVLTSNNSENTALTFAYIVL